MDRYYEMINVIYEKYEEGMINEKTKNSLIETIKNKIAAAKVNKHTKDVDDRTEEFNDLFVAYRNPKKCLKNKTDDTEDNDKDNARLKRSFA